VERLVGTIRPNCSTLRNTAWSLTITAPPLRATARIMSSVMFRAWFAMTRLDGFVEDQPLRRVVVRVDDDRAVVQLLRARGGRIYRCLRKDDNGSR
jgi:hypothetical protein